MVNLFISFEIYLVVFAVFEILFTLADSSAGFVTLFNLFWFVDLICLRWILINI